jgi:hypothetical protein
VKRFTSAVVALLALIAAVSATAVAGGVKASTIYNSTVPNGPAANVPSVGPEAYGFDELGSTVTFVGTARHLTSVTVGLSSWACASGAWNTNDCSTPAGATFPQAITRNVYAADGATVLATQTQTFNIPFRPSASAKCGDGRWYSSGTKTCFNGLYNEVTFSFSGVTLPNSVVYGVAFNTNTAGPAPLGFTSPADSLNIALVDATAVSAGSDSGIVAKSPHGATAFAGAPAWAGLVPAVQFKASN